MTTQEHTAAETSATPTRREVFIAKKASYAAMLAKDLTFSGTDEEWSEHWHAMRQALQDLILTPTACTTCILEKLSLIADELREIREAGNLATCNELIWIAAIQTNILYAKEQMNEESLFERRSLREATARKQTNT